MRGRGMKRCRAEGADRFALFVAAPVLADNLMIIVSKFLTKRSRRAVKPTDSSSADQRRGGTNRYPYRDAQHNCTSQ